MLLVFFRSALLRSFQWIRTHQFFYDLEKIIPEWSLNTPRQFLWVWQRYINIIKLT